MNPTEQQCIIDLCRSILATMAHGGDAQAQLDALCRLQEQASPSSLAALMIPTHRGRGLRVLAAPSLPSRMAEGLDGLPAEAADVFGMHAADDQVPVIVADTSSDPRWLAWRDMARELGIMACWSMPIRHDNGQPWGIFALFGTQPSVPNATQLKLLDMGAVAAGLVIHRMRLMENASILDAALAATTDAVLLANPDGVIEWVNPAFTTMTGFAAEDIIGATPQILHGPLTDPEVKARIRDALRQGQSFRGEILYYRKDGSLLWNELNINPVFDARGKVQRFFGIHRDTTAMHAMREQVERMAYTDPLTALPNRHALESFLSQALLRAKQNKTQVLVGMLDVDDFKPVNDTWGHATGDALLRALASRLQAAVRETDLVARYGGDEFVVVLVDLQAFDDLPLIMQRIHAAVEQPFSMRDGVQIRVGLSMGMTQYPQDDADGEVLLRHADAALYRSKTNKAGREAWWEFWQPAALPAAADARGMNGS
ncbi:diguanylate cyclase [Thiomonas sp.]|uniref:diguanylate cyclase domain-containing protein n=1 Tax=Thiomonas sp. TaxID=2047785 RepID=UPI00258C963A|nr:diguanylate cyclase [Thiomonas sp.]